MKVICKREHRYYDWIPVGQTGELTIKYYTNRVYPRYEVKIGKFEHSYKKFEYTKNWILESELRMRKLIKLNKKHDKNHKK